MKTIPLSLINHKKQANTTLTQIFKLTLRNGTVLGFTSFDQDIVLEDEPNVIYSANSGMTASALSSSSKFNVDNMDVEGFLENEKITESDLKSGKYDYADIIIGELNWNDKPYNWSKVDFKTSNLGEVKIEGGKFIAEVRGLMQHYQTNTGPMFQATCRAEFCDSKCKLNIVNYTYQSFVSSVTNNKIINCNLNKAENTFSKGRIMFTSGLNNDLTLDVKYSNGGMIELMLPANYTINMNDTFDIIEGCNGVIENCQDRFGNAINFRGEPFIPLTSQLMNN